MSNIRSLGDFSSERQSGNYSFAGGQHSGIGIEDGRHFVHLYADGFTLDNGPFRTLDNPDNERFVSEIKRGVAPSELQDGNKQVMVYLVDKSTTSYNSRDSPSAGTTNGVATSEPSSSSRSHVKVINGTLNSGSASTVLRLKLHNDLHVNLTVGNDTSVGELRAYISQVTGLPVSDFKLLGGFPPREIVSEDSDSIHSADLLACTIIQKCFN